MKYVPLDSCLSFPNYFSKVSKLKFPKTIYLRIVSKGWNDNSTKLLLAYEYLFESCIQVSAYGLWRFTIQQNAIYLAISFTVLLLISKSECTYNVYSVSSQKNCKKVKTLSFDRFG